ncbi:MAG: hypothetical protein EA426_18105 [Spirochaetaceae bacterium]|nr:MAG: hypothetical protein EA426_18105 [Spirochaetaceae bacterium]
MPAATSSSTAARKFSLASTSWSISGIRSSQPALRRGRPPRYCAEVGYVSANSSRMRRAVGEALEEALCFGWIDGRLESLGAEQYLKRFTPRRKRSVWSERNRKLARRLIEEGRMTEAGKAAIAQAQKLGTWDTPKPAPITDVEIDVLAEALSGSEKALTNFLNMSASVKRTYTAFYLSAKGEDTRKRRLDGIIERLKENKKPM